MKNETREKEKSGEEVFFFDDSVGDDDQGSEGVKEAGKDANRDTGENFFTIKIDKVNVESAGEDGNKADDVELTVKKIMGAGED